MKKIKNIIENHTYGEDIKNEMHDLLLEFYVELFRTPNREKGHVLRKFLRRIGIQQDAHSALQGKFKFKGDL